MILDATQNIGALTPKGNHGFSLSSTRGAVLATTAGISVTATVPATHTVSAPIQMNAFNLLDVPTGQTLNLSGPLSGAGFYKQGAGDLNVSGANTYNGADSAVAVNGLIIRGGMNTFSGTNTIIGAINIGFNVRQDRHRWLPDRQWRQLRDLSAHGQCQRFGQRLRRPPRWRWCE